MVILITFDIDETLLSLKKNNIMGYVKAYGDAFSSLFGKPENLRDFLPPHMVGLTDLAIIRYSVSKALNKDITETNEEIENNIKKFTEIFGKDFASKCTDEIEIAKGITELLDTLKKRDDVIVGLCTGNLREIGETKLKKVGLFDYFDPLASGFCLHENRGELLKMIINNLQNDHKIKIDKVIHVGDTKLDIDAAKYVNAIPVLVKQFSKETDDFPDVCIIDDYESGKDKLLSLL